MTLIHSQASRRARQLVTRLVFGLWAVKALLDSPERLAVLPHSVYEPVGFLAVLPEAIWSTLLRVEWLVGLKLATLLVLGLVLLGRGGRLAPVAACVLLTLRQGLKRGFAGHLEHQDLVLLYAAYLLALCPLADRLVPPQHRRVPASWTLDGVPLVGIVLALCLTYTFAGVYRLLHGGLALFTSAQLPAFVARNSLQLVHPTGNLGHWVLNSPAAAWLLAVGFPFVTAFEVLAPLCLFVRGFRYAFVAVMVPFHVLSWLVMQVWFWENLVLYVLFFDLDRLVSRRLPGQRIRWVRALFNSSRAAPSET